MDRIALIDGYDQKRVRETLNLLLRDRKNEFREIADSIGIPTTSEDWEVIILKFCLDYEDCFKTWTADPEPSTLKNTKCMTIMRSFARKKKSFPEIVHLQNMANTLYTEFHQTYKRVS